MSKEMTKKEKIMHILEIEEVKKDSIAVDYLNNELKLLDKKKENNAKKKSGDAALKQELVTILTAAGDKGLTSMNISMKFNPVISPQKAIALLTELMAEGKIKRYTEKRIVYFTLTTTTAAQKEGEEEENTNQPLIPTTEE